MAGCIVCYGDAKQQPLPDGRDGYRWNCVRCGVFDTASSLKVILNSTKYSDSFRFSASHAIRTAQRPSGGPVSYDTVSFDVIANQELPSVEEQINTLILHLGDHQPAPADRVGHRRHAWCAILGTRDSAQKLDCPNLFYILHHLNAEGLVDFTDGGEHLFLNLKVKGWTSYTELKRKRSDSRRVFMAMAFGNLTLSKIVKENFKPAIALTGYELIRVDDYNKAGSIDDRIRVEIRNSRMMIADLTDQNRGAYWEAGFAEGLGKPVIYTCEESVFENKDHIHFDTSHFYCVQWSMRNPQKAADDLKFAIRNTLPTEAMLED